MKKLMIALAAAATTMFSFGDVTLPTGTSFEALTEGPVTVGDIVNRDDSGNPSGSEFYWYSTASETDEPGAITNDVAGSGVSRPDMFANQNTKSLQIDTTAPLVRTALPNSGASNVSPVTIGTDGIYLDTLVKFTAADEAFAEDLTGGDKIAIEYVEHEAEGDDVGYTNFVVRAGLIVGSGLSQQIEQTNYVAAVPAGFDKNEWHRLTVRTIADVGDGNVGFVIYLDGDVNKTLEYSTDVDAGFGTLNNAVAEKFYNSEKHALFPSAIAAGDIGGSTISSVAFSGNGFIDDVSFAAEAPNFIKAGEAVVATFVADAGVTAISVSVAGVTDPISVVNGSATLPAGTTAFKVNVTVDTANGYTLGGISYGGTPVVDGEVTGYAGGDITITTVRNNFNLFDANGDPIQGTFQTLSDALAAQNVAKIVLAHSYNVAENEGNKFVTYNIDSNITLDLNGNTITCGGEDALFTVGSGVTMIVIDSLAANTGKIDYTGTYAVFFSEGDVVIGATTGDYGPTIDGYLAAADDEGDGIWLIKGKIEAAANSKEGAFLWNGYLGNSEGTITSGADLDSDEEYWVVTPQSGPTTTFALTTTGGANATITTDPAAVSALTEETEVTITATADQDYTYDGVDLTGTDWTYNSQTDAISMTTNISENTTVKVPDAVSEQSQEDWPNGQDLIDAEGKAAGDLFPGITNALATADAKAVATWAEANNVAYAAKGSILPEAFLLNCANTQAAIDEAAANFKITSITVAGDTVTIAPADGADYGNGKVVIEGTATLSPISWHAKQAGDHFFRATLVVKPVAVE